MGHSGNNYYWVKKKKKQHRIIFLQSKETSEMEVFIFLIRDEGLKLVEIQVRFNKDQERGVSI